MPSSTPHSNPTLDPQGRRQPVLLNIWPHVILLPSPRDWLFSRGHRGHQLSLAQLCGRTALSLPAPSLPGHSTPSRTNPPAALKLFWWRSPHCAISRGRAQGRPTVAHIPARIPARPGCVPDKCRFRSLGQGAHAGPGSRVSAERVRNRHLAQHICPRELPSDSRHRALPTSPRRLQTLPRWLPALGLSLRTS